MVKFAAFIIGLASAFAAYSMLSSGSMWFGLGMSFIALVTFALVLMPDQAQAEERRFDQRRGYR